MPRRKRKYERKTTVYRRKKRKKSRRRRIPKGLFAKTTKMAFRYVDTVTINPDAGSNFVYLTYSANGMYDPDTTGIGHQPYGFDQYMQFYNHYTVIGAKMNVKFQAPAPTTTAAGTAYVGIMQTAGPTPGITSINTVQESKRSNCRIQPLAGTARATSINSTVNLSKVFGQKVLQEDNNAGTATSQPAEQWYWQIMAATNSVGVVNPDPIQCLVTIDYIVILHEPKDIAGS